MTLIISALNPTHVWLYFILLQVALFFAHRNYDLARELLVPYEIVLIAAAFLFLLAAIPGVIFFTVICTIAGLAFSLYLSTFINDKILK